MPSRDRADVVETVERLVEEVASWTGVRAGKHRYEATEWRLGSRETGHVLPSGMLHDASLRALGNVPVAEGTTGGHGPLDESRGRGSTPGDPRTTTTPAGWSGCRTATTSTR